MFTLQLWNTIYVFNPNVKGQLAILKQDSDGTLKVVESSIESEQLEEFFHTKVYAVS